MAPKTTLNGLIDAAGISIGDLTRKAGLSPHSLWKLRNGLTSKARSTTVAALAKAIKTTAAKVRAAIEASAAERAAKAD